MSCLSLASGLLGKPRGRFDLGAHRSSGEVAGAQLAGGRAAYVQWVRLRVVVRGGLEREEPDLWPVPCVTTNGPRAASGASDIAPLYRGVRRLAPAQQCVAAERCNNRTELIRRIGER
jgi:hypothetical protein